MSYFDDEDYDYRDLLMWVLVISIGGTGRWLHILNGMFRFESNNWREMCQFPVLVDRRGIHYCYHMTAK